MANAKSLLRNEHFLQVYSKIKLGLGKEKDWSLDEEYNE